MQNVYPRSQRHAIRDVGKRRSRLFHRRSPLSKTFVVVKIFRFRHRIAINLITGERIQGFMYVLVPSFRPTPDSRFLPNPKQFLQIWIAPHIHFYQIIDHQNSNRLVSFSIHCWTHLFFCLPKNQECIMLCWKCADFGQLLVSGLSMQLTLGLSNYTKNCKWSRKEAWCWLVSPR